MSIELQKSLPERAKEFLQVDGEHSLFELADLLRQFRNETHPDRFTDEEIKKRKAEDRVKVAHSLLDEIEKQLQVERFNRQPMGLAAYKPLYDIVQLQSDYDKIKNDLDTIKSELACERETNAALNQQLADKNENSLKAEIQHLQEFYRPSTRKFASIGMAIVLPAVLAIMTQMEQVSNVIQKYSPLPQQLCNHSTLRNAIEKEKPTCDLRQKFCYLGRVDRFV